MTSSSNNENFISGIYNYCDRWCERCPFTARCRVFAKEQESPDDDGDIESVLRKVKAAFVETKQMLLESADELGIDPFELSDEEFAEIQSREKKFVDEDELSQLADRYWKSARTILDNESVWNHESLDDLRSVLCWYLFFIPVKVKSGLHGLLDEEGFEDKSQQTDPQSHANGTVKIGLIAIERSLAAWNQFDSFSVAEVKPIVELLTTIKTKLEARFPLAWDFVRPGFDEIEVVM